MKLEVSVTDYDNFVVLGKTLSVSVDVPLTRVNMLLRCFT